MFFILISFFIRKSLECDEIDTELVFTNKIIKKGEKYCIKAKLPNLLVITNFLKNVQITYGLSSSVDDNFETAGNLSPSPYFFFKDFATLFFEAKNEDSHLSFSAITLPDECKNNAWYSNIPLSNFSISDIKADDIEYTIKYKTFCVFFSTNDVQEYSIYADLPNENDKLSIGEDIYNGISVTCPFKAYRKQYFLVNFDEKSNKQNNRKIIIKNINKDYLMPTIPGCGYIVSETTIENQHSRNIMIFIIIILIFIACIFLIVRNYFSAKPINFKYENIRNF